MNRRAIDSFFLLIDLVDNVSNPALAYSFLFPVHMIFDDTVRS